MVIGKIRLAVITPQVEARRAMRVGKLWSVVGKIYCRRATKRVRIPVPFHLATLLQSGPSDMQTGGVQPLRHFGIV